MNLHVLFLQICWERKQQLVPVLLVPALDEISFKTAKNTLFYAQ